MFCSIFAKYNNEESRVYYVQWYVGLTDWGYDAKLRLLEYSDLKLLLLLNPHAAAGRAAALSEDISKKLGAFAEVDLLLTSGPGDATRRVAEANLDGIDAVVAAGGDGTLFEVLNGLYENACEQKPPLGVIPVGTGNAFARDLGLEPGDWKKGIDIIASGRKRPFDIGRVQSQAGTYHFLNIVGAGLPVDAMLTAARLKFIGRVAYTVATLWRAMQLKTYPLNIVLDGDRVEQESMFIEVSNTRYTGTSFLIAPDAQPDDGLFDITLVRKLGRTRLLRLFPTIYKGEHVRYEEVTTYRAKEITIEGPDGLLLAPDGELRGATPATITCLYRDLEIFTAVF